MLSISRILSWVVFVAFNVVLSHARNITTTITQSAVKITGDTKPIINLCEVQYFQDGVRQTVGTDAFTFASYSSNYPTNLCNDLNTQVGSGPYNMCKSGNTLNTQTMTIITGDLSFNIIKVFNAYGFNNPSGDDVGGRIVDATISVKDQDTGVVIYSSVFDSFKTEYQFSPIPVATTPSAAPASRKPTATPTRVLTELRKQKVPSDDEPWSDDAAVNKAKEDKSEGQNDVASDDEPYVPPEKQQQGSAGDKGDKYAPQKKSGFEEDFVARSAHN